MSESNFPTRVKINSADVARALSQKVLADKAVVKLVVDKIEAVTAPTKGQGPGEDLKLKVTYGIIDPKNKQQRVKGQRIWANYTLPVCHPDFPQHKYPEWAVGFWAEFVQAMDPENHPKRPTIKDGQWMYKGKKVKPTDLAKIEQDRMQAIFDAAAEAVEKRGAQFKLSTCYATVSQSKADSGRIFTNANNLRAELGAGEKLTPADKLVVSVGMDGEAESTTETEEKGQSSSRRRRR